jgi:membrane protease YdiL (CAAX protease family)
MKKFFDRPGALRAYGSIGALFLILLLEDCALLGLLSLICGRAFLESFRSGTLTPHQSVVYVALLYLVMVATIVGFWKVMSGQSMAGAGLRLSGQSGALLLKGGLFGLAAFSIFFLPLILFHAASLAKFHEACARALTLAFFLHLLVNALVIFAIALTEELVFRGVIFNVLLKNTSRLQAVIATGVIFGGCHMFSHGPWSMKLMYFVTLFFLSATLSWTVLITGELWWAVGIHGTIIFLSMIKDYLGILTLSRTGGPWEIVYGFAGSPMAGLWSVTIFLLMFLAVLRYRASSLTSEEPALIEGEPACEIA